MTEREFAAHARSMMRQGRHEETCTHCGGPPTDEMLRDHPFYPWRSTRIGPSGEWHHHYCSDECARHADEYSKKAWAARNAHV